MSNRWCDGFGRYGGSETAMLNGSSGQAWAQVDTGNWLLSSANPRTGSWHMRSGNSIGSGPLRRVFGAALTEVFVGFASYFSDLPATEPAGFSSQGVVLASFRDAANGIQLSVVLGTDGGLVIYRGGDGSGLGSGFENTVLLHRTAPVIGAGAYQHIEIYAKAGNSTAGALEIRVDEVTKVNLTGIDTVFTSNVEFSQIAFIVDGTPGVTWDLADVFANDTTADDSGCDTWIGDVKSGSVLVNADTAQADFALSSGVSGYALLDETPPNDSDYIDTASATAESDFGLPDAPANISEILTVRPFVRAMKDDAGTCTIAPNVKSNGTKGTVSDQPVTTEFAYYDSNVPVDPDTGVPWTPSGFNAVEHVVERTA